MTTDSDFLASNSESLRLPPACAQTRKLGISIHANGDWFYQDSPIKRPALVAWFASLMRRAEDGGYWLVNGFERGLISVEDAPFIITAFDFQPDGTLVAQDNIARRWVCSEARPLWMSEQGQTIAPYLYLEKDLSAKITRAAYYDLIDHASEQDGAFGYCSQGTFFPFLASPPPFIIAP